MLAGMMARPRATSDRTSSGDTPSRRATNSRVGDLCANATAKAGAGQATGSACRGQDTDEHPRLGPEALADIAAHPEGNEDPVLAVIGGEDLRLEIGPVVHPLRAPLEGGSVRAAHVHGHPAVVLDAPGLEAGPLGGEVESAVVEPAPRGHGAGLARRAIGGEVNVARAREGGAQLGNERRGHDGGCGVACAGTASLLPLPHAAFRRPGRRPPSLVLARESLAT